MYHDSHYLQNLCKVLTSPAAQMEHPHILIFRFYFGNSNSDCILERLAALFVTEHAYLSGRHLDICLDGDIVVGVFHVMIALSLQGSEFLTSARCKRLSIISAESTERFLIRHFSCHPPRLYCLELQTEAAKIFTSCKCLVTAGGRALQNFFL